MSRTVYPQPSHERPWTDERSRRRWDRGLRLDRIQEPPISRFRDELLRAGADHASVAEAERVETHAVLRIVFVPPAVWQVVQQLQLVVIARHISAVDEHSRGALGLAHAVVGRVQQRARCPHGSYRISLDEVAVAG